MAFSRMVLGVEFPGHHAGYISHPRAFAARLDLVWAGGILAYWWSTGRGRYHYWVAAGVLVILAFLPLIDLLPAGDEMLRVFFATLGMIYIAGGILDHLELARILKMAEA